MSEQQAVQPTRADVLALARTSFAAFISAFFEKFMLPPHIRLLVDRFEAVVRGDLMRLLVSMPPRHGKSETLSVYGIPFFLGNHPDRKAIFCTYNSYNADTYGRRIRNVMSHPLYRAIWPETVLEGDSSAIDRMTTTKGGGVIATGRGGSLTGHGGDLIICDDIIKGQEEAYSPVLRGQVQEWMQHDLFTRLEPDGRMIFVGTRWAIDDPIGWVQREQAAECWETINLPALAEPDDPLGRAEGEPLFPARFTRAALERRKAQVGPRAWAAEYQGRPVPLEGAIFKAECFEYFEDPPEFSRVVISIDSAFKVKSTSDYSVATVWGETKVGFYLLDVVRGRYEFPELQRVVENLAAKWSPVHYVLIEDAASGQSLIQALQRDTRLPIKPVKVDRDKITRASAVTGLVESRRVFLRKDASWLPDFLEELCTFPAAPHDDQVDSAVQALNFLRYIPHSGLFDYVIAAAEAAEKDEAEAA